MHVLLCSELTRNVRFNWNMYNFKFNFLSWGQRESSNLDKIFLPLLKILPCCEFFFHNFTFAIIAWMLCWNNLKSPGLIEGHRVDLCWESQQLPFPLSLCGTQWGNCIFLDVFVRSLRFSSGTKLSLHFDLWSFLAGKLWKCYAILDELDN